MTETLTLDMICTLSEDVVVREIEGELIIIPLAAGIGDMEDELYTLNETGKVIWGKLDGTRSLRAVVQELSAEYTTHATDIERDVTGLVVELVRRKIVVVQ